MPETNPKKDTGKIILPPIPEHPKEEARVRTFLHQNSETGVISWIGLPGVTTYGVMITESMPISLTSSPLWIEEVNATQIDIDRLDFKPARNSVVKLGVKCLLANGEWSETSWCNISEKPCIARKREGTKNNSPSSEPQPLRLKPVSNLGDSLKLGVKCGEWWQTLRLWIKGVGVAWMIAKVALVAVILGGLTMLVIVVVPLLNHLDAPLQWPDTVVSDVIDITPTKEAGVVDSSLTLLRDDDINFIYPKEGWSVKVTELTGKNEKVFGALSTPNSTVVWVPATKKGIEGKEIVSLRVHSLKEPVTVKFRLTKLK